VELQAMKEILYGSRMFSFNQIKDACEKAGVDKDIFTAIEAELIETFSRQDDHDCHASPEDGCTECEKQLDDMSEEWALREREDFDRAVSTHENSYLDSFAD
jgi:hypothetical protein